MSIDEVEAVIICASNVGNIISLETIFQQLLISRDRQVNAQLNIQALKQQRDLLTHKRANINQTLPQNSSLYDDFKFDLIYIEQRLDLAYQQKSELLEKKIQLLEKYFYQTNLTNTIYDLSKHNHDFNMQFESVKQSIKLLLFNKQKLLDKKFDFVKKTSSKHLKNKHSTQQVTLTKMMMKSSKSLMSMSNIAPVKFKGTYFVSNSQLTNNRMGKERSDRNKIITIENQLNLIGGNTKSFLTV